jgi:uncharacterized membrane protein YgaE (UPF0421/DUF939 family)
MDARTPTRIGMAAARSRTSARTRGLRLVAAGRSILQIALAATLAWLLAIEVLGHPRPFFAPVAAIVTLGVAYGQRGRRAVELALGVATGILVADVIVLLLGPGTLTLGLVVILAVSIAVLLGSGPLLTNQAGISAVLVVTIGRPQAGVFSFDRFFDALAGGAVALAVSALFLPTNPVALIRHAAAPVLAELAATLEDVARAVVALDLGLAEPALERARSLDVLGAQFADAIAVGRETARLAPPGRRSREQVDHYAEAAAQVDLAVRNVRVLARGVIRGIRLGDHLPPDVGDAVLELAAAVRALEPALEDPAAAEALRAPALRAAATATRILERTGNLSISVIVGQIRSTAVDLLRGSGLEAGAAADAVRDAAREARDP